MLPGLTRRQAHGIVRAYWESGQPHPASKHQIAEWALREGRWAPTPTDLTVALADTLAKAMGEEHHTDNQGRMVRSKHPRRVRRNGKQLTLWEDVREADRPFMAVAFQQRRRGIAAECRQLKTDIDSYNDNLNPGPPIQIVLDFTDDVAEHIRADRPAKLGEPIVPLRPSWQSPHVPPA